MTANDNSKITGKDITKQTNLSNFDRELYCKVLN